MRHILSILSYCLLFKVEKLKLLTFQKNHPYNEIMNDWEKEFPLFYKFKTPKVLFADLIIGIEKWLRRIVFYGTCLLILYVLYYRLNQFFIVKDFSGITFFPPIEDWALWTWKAFRNFFYLFLFFDFLLCIPVTIIYAVRGNYPKLVKLVYGFFMLLLFVTFSYAIAGLISDLIMAGTYAYWSALKQSGAPITKIPFEIKYK